MNKKFIVCGNGLEYVDFATSKKGDNIYYYWIRNAKDMRNFSSINPNGYFIGTWKDLPEIDDIITEIVLKLSPDNEKFQTVFELRLKLLVYSIMR